MSRVPLPFAGGEYEGYVSVVNPQKAVNCYTISEREGGKYPLIMIGTPGLTEFGDPGASGESRGEIKVADVLYRVVGSTFYSVDSNGTHTSLGTINTSSGFLQIASNDVDIMIIDDAGGYYHVLSTGTFADIDDPDFPAASSLTEQDGYYIVSIRGTNQFAISGLLSANTWDALDFSSADGSLGDIVAVKSDHRELWILKKDNGEIWWNSGDSDFPFERVSGATLEVGLSERRSIASCDNTLFWLDDNYKVRRATSKFAPSIVSSSQIEYQISELSDKSCVAFSYIGVGGEFYTLVFPGLCVEYNVATKFWHSRTSGANDGRWRGNSFCRCYNKNLVGDFENGKLYEMDYGTYTDNGDVIRRTRISPISHKRRMPFVIDQLEVEFEPGVGTDDIDPQVMLRYSKNGGRTWSDELWRSIGKIGEYNNKALWKRMGQSETWAFEIVFTDAIKFVVAHVWADIRGRKN